MNKEKPFKFQPFSNKQKKVLTWWMHHSPHSQKDIIIVDGAIRAGKTIAMIDGFIMWSIHNFSDKDFIIAGKTIGTLKRNVIRPLIKILLAKGIDFDYNRSQNILWFGGNTYYLLDANNEASQDRLQGMTAAGAIADEVTLFPNNYINQMISRCSIKGSKIWMNCNPKGPNHFIKKEFIDKAEQKNIFRIHFKLDDNLTLANEIKERYKSMFSGVFYKRYILGEWVIAENIIYDMFDNGKHVISKIPQNVNMINHWVGVDYGTSNATVFLLVGLGTDNNLYVIDEYYYSGRESGKAKTDKEFSNEMIDWLKVKPKWIFIDPSAKSFITQLWNDRHKCSNLKKVTKANNDVIDGIRKVSSLLASDKLYMLNTCKKTIEEFELYSWNQKAQDKGEDKPAKVNDHTMDAIRYTINGLGNVYKNIIQLD